MTAVPSSNAPPITRPITGPITGPGLGRACPAMAAERSRVEDVARHLLIDERRPQRLNLGAAHRPGLRVGDQHREGAARISGSDARAGIAGTVRSEWDALGGVALAETRSPVMVFETGLPSRRHIDRLAVRFEHLVSSNRVFSCPSKATTSHWSVEVGGSRREDLVWSYDFRPLRWL